VVGSFGGLGGSALGAGVGAVGGGFAAGVPLEIGSEFIGRISQELSERGLPPTEENITALLRDKTVVDKAISDARTKGVTTAAIDSLMTVGAGKFASGARRSAIDAARKEMGVAADAAKIAARADAILKSRTLGQKGARVAGAVGIETAGGGISEAAGQAAAYGEVDLEDVGAEMLGELGGSALSVPAAAYSTTQDLLRSKARKDAAAIIADEEKSRVPPVVDQESPPITPVEEDEVLTPTARYDDVDGVEQTGELTPPAKVADPAVVDNLNDRIEPVFLPGFTGTTTIERDGKTTTTNRTVAETAQQKFERLSRQSGKMANAYRDKILTSQEYDKFRADLDAARQAASEETQGELSPAKQEILDIANKLEAAGVKGVPDGMRNAAQLNAREPDAQSMEFYRSKLKPYEKKQDAVETESYGLPEFFSSDKKESARISDLLKSGPLKTRIALGEANAMIQRLAQTIQAAGFDVRDLVQGQVPDGIMNIKRQISNVAARAGRLANSAEAVQKKYKRANPERVKADIAGLMSDVNEAGNLIDEDQTLPLMAEEMAGVPAPVSPEVEDLLTQQRLASEDIAILSKRTRGTSLMGVLTGTLKDSEMSELGGKGRKIGKNPFISLVAKKGSRGLVMEDVVASGKLDMFLPVNMQTGQPDHDGAESAEYIRESLRAGDFYTNDTRNEIAQIQSGIWDIQKQIDEELSLDEINREIQYAADEQRELDQEASSTATDGAFEAPEDSASTKAEEGLTESSVDEAADNQEQGEPQDFLKSQTEQEIREKQAEIDRLNKENERLSAEAERKAKADEQVGDFVLTGSSRDVDEAEARGQANIFSTPAEEKKPAKTVVVAPDGARLRYPLAVAMVDKGYEVLSLDDPRTYTDKGGTPHRTFEKGPVRISMTPQQVLFQDRYGANYGFGNEDDLVLQALLVDPDKRNQGLATQAMQDVIDAADANKITLYLEPTPLIDIKNKEVGPDRDQLANFYSKFGFEFSPEADRVMQRQPNAETVRGQEPMFSSQTGTGYNISAEDQRIESELTGKSMIQVADWAAANAPNAFARVIAEKVRNRLLAFQRKGMTLDFVIEGGSTRTNKLRSARGVAQFDWGNDDKGTTITVTLNGAAVMNNQGGYPPGVQYNTVLHELLHVATRSQFVFMPNTDPLRVQMTALFNAVAERFNADAKAGKLPPVMERYYKRMNNVLQDTDEILAWGLTDKEVQAYLDDIKVGEKSVFTELVELIRKALGLGKPYESALERLVRTSESMLDVDVDAIDAMLGQRDKQIGVKKKPAGPMTQESLFQKESSPAPSWVPEKIWRLHELMQRADDEAEGRVPLRENEQGKVPTSGALKRNQTMTFRRLNAAVDEHVGGDYQKSMDLMTRMNEESNRRADEVESGTLEMRDAPKAPPTDSAAFKKWFGDSKVVDENGEPVVVYHGTLKEFTQFEASKQDKRDAGFWFGDAKNANVYAASGEPRGNNVMPVYLSIKNPKVYYNRDVKITPELIEKLKAEGYDGVMRDFANGPDAWRYGEDAAPEWAAFEPGQVKSATGNIGTYDPDNADIRYQREAELEVGQPKPSRQNIFGEPVLGTWSITVDPKMEIQDGLIYKMLDKNVDVKRIIEAVKETGKEIASKWNPYLQEELYHGRTATASKDFQNDEWLPLLKDMQEKDVTVGELEKYLLNRHAEAYNNFVAKRNPTRPEMQDGGSSVTTENAQKYLAGLSENQKQKFEALAKRVDAITKGTRKLLADTGYEKVETIDAWEETFPNYVPLMREEMGFDYNFGSFGTGRGFDVRRDFSRSAMGSKRNVVDIISNVISARNNAISLTEKNRVAQAVYGLALEAPNPDFWMAINPEAEKIPQDALDELLSMGLDDEAVNFLMKEPKQRVLDPKKNEVMSRINTKLRENDYVLATRVNGERRYVFFNQQDPRAERAARALKNLDAQDLGTAMGIIAKVTRWMAAVNTQYNPIFGPYNFLRDAQAAALQLSTTELAGQQAEVSKEIIPSLRVIYLSLRKSRKGKKVDGDLAKLWKEFQQEGGQTGFKDNFSRTQDRSEALVNEMEKLSEGKAKAGARAVFDWLSDYNDSLENAVRLAAYKVAKKKFAGEGFSDSEAKQKAASLAKNLTVNFNRKGDVAIQMGALYAFFNAAMQGSARMIETLRGPTGKKIMAGGLMLGSMQALLLAGAGFDDEDPPEFVRAKNIIIPTGGGDYIAIPMPLGFHVIPGVSRILTEWAISGFDDTARRTTDLLGLFLDAFNPIGNSGWSVQTVTPTVLDPFVALGENKDFTGKPISRNDLFSLRPTPGYTRAREGANWFSMQLSEFLNFASGGTKYQKGMFSPTPEQIEYLAGQAFGGIGRESMKLATTIEKTITGEELPIYKIPLYGRFVGETKGSAAESSRFYKNIERLNGMDLEIKGRRENREPTRDFMLDNPEARLLPMANKTYKAIQALRKRRTQLLERNASREAVQRVEAAITKRMKILNDRVKSIKDK
jgi:GNAT superfamily N-acetyltransferase